MSQWCRITAGRDVLKASLESMQGSTSCTYILMYLLTSMVEVQLMCSV